MGETEITTKKVCELLWQFEKETDALNLDIQGVKVWQLVRFDIFLEITIKIGLYEQAHTLKDSLRDKLQALPRVIYNAIAKNPLLGKDTKDILIFDHARKVSTEGNYIDIYTHYFIESLKKEEFEVVEEPYLWKHYTNRRDLNRSYTDAIILNSFVKKIFPSIRLTENEIAILGRLEKKLVETFNVKIELITRVKKKIIDFKLQYDYYSKLLKRRKPSKIYLVVSYFKGPLISAAKDNGIEVIEFQHGVITPYHVAYSFPHINQQLDYFPDKILTFGEYWSNATQFPSGVNLEVYGFPYMKSKISLYNVAEKNKQQILFLSQGTIGVKLAEHAYNVARKLTDYKILYKLHPGEYERWKESYPSLVKASKLENFTVIDHNEKNLYSYFAESEFQVGVYSTAIFEGLTFNCKTILFKLAGIDYMEDLINKKIVQVAETDEECVKIIKNYQHEPFANDYFFKVE